MGSSFSRWKSLIRTIDILVFYSDGSDLLPATCFNFLLAHGTPKTAAPPADLTTFFHFVK